MRFPVVRKLPFAEKKLRCLPMLEPRLKEIIDDTFVSSSYGRKCFVYSSRFSPNFLNPFFPSAVILLTFPEKRADESGCVRKKEKRADEGRPTRRSARSPSSSEGTPVPPPKVESPVDSSGFAPPHVCVGGFKISIMHRTQRD